MNHPAAVLRFSVFLSTLLFFCNPLVDVLAAHHSPKRVFILHSYEANHVCGQPQHDGIVAGLKTAGFKEHENFVIATYYMDTKRKNNTPKKMQHQAVEALKKIEAFNPDVLITLDDNAFRLVALQLEEPVFPVVFSGMNGQPEDYNKIRPFMDNRSHPGHHVTGVYEKLHIVDALKVHSKLFPELKKARIFVDESPTGQAIQKQIRLELTGDAIPCAWDIRIIKTWEEYQKEILKTNQDTEVGVVYPAALLLKDAEGRTYTAPEIFSWTIKRSEKPEIAINFAFTRLGLFGGASVDFYAMGVQAGQMVARVLEGESPGAISIEEAHKYALSFNLNRAEKLGIELPSDVIMAADEVFSETEPQGDRRK